MNKNLKYCIIPTIFLIILIILLFLEKLGSFDYLIAKMIYHNNLLTTIFKIITWFGSTYGIIAICLCLILIIKDRHQLIWLYLTIITSTLINNIVKIIIARPRPNLTPLVVEDTYSFPSGHAMATMTFYGALIYLIWQSQLSLKTKKILTIILISLILLIGFSRIYLNVHHTTDILAGFSFSIIILNLAILLNKKYLKS